MLKSDKKIHVLLLIFMTANVKSSDVQSINRLHSSHLFGNRFGSDSLLNGTLDSWRRALDTMSYHRNMMNEYLCRNYVANEIVETLRNKSEISIDKRMGLQRKPKLVTASLLADQGSKQYKDWLSRSTTLEDIYRHYENNLDEAEDAPVQQTVPSTGGDVGHGGGGDVTGYAIVGNKLADSSGHSGYGAGTTYGVPDYGHQVKYEQEDDEKGMKLKDLFQLALTAIAFLAFGTFVCEVIMCVTGLHNTNEQLMLMPSMTPMMQMPMQPPDGGRFKERPFQEGPEIDPLNNRQQRASASFFPLIPIDILNEMSSRVLSSIEALTVIENDNGRCLKRTLCETNKYSRKLAGIQQIWLPLWSFGASYVAGRILKNQESSTVFEFLKSSILGLGNADCHRLYQDCAAERKNKRKKRQTGS